MDRFIPAVSPQFLKPHVQSALRNLLILEQLNLHETIALGKSDAILRRKILKFANGRMFRELKRFFDLEMLQHDGEEPIEPVELQEPI